MTTTALETERRRTVVTRTLRLAFLPGLGPSVRIGKLCCTVSHSSVAYHRQGLLIPPAKPVVAQMSLRDSCPP